MVPVRPKNVRLGKRPYDVHGRDIRLDHYRQAGCTELCGHGRRNGECAQIHRHDDGRGRATERIVQDDGYTLVSRAAQQACPRGRETGNRLAAGGYRICRGGRCDQRRPRRIGRGGDPGYRKTFVDLRRCRENGLGKSHAGRGRCHQRSLPKLHRFGFLFGRFREPYGRCG